MMSFTFDWSKLWDMVMTWVQEYGFQIAKALVVLLIGWLLIKYLILLLKKILKRSSVDDSAIPVLLTVSDFGLKLLLLLQVAGMLGFDTTSLIAMLGAAGLAVGFALRDSLSNFAGGILLLVLKPFRKDDLIECQGEIGVVRNIEVFNTEITTPHNKAVFIPNSNIINNNIVNYSKNGIIRVDVPLGISYSSDIKLARDIAMRELQNSERTLDDREMIVYVTNLGESSVDLSARAYCTTANYWDAMFELTETIKLAYDKAGISIPFPQRDLHIISGTLD